MRETTAEPSNLLAEQKQLVFDEFIAAIIQDPVLFVKLVLGIETFEYQSQLLRDQNKRIVVLTTRQIGKSFNTSTSAI